MYSPLTAFAIAAVDKITAGSDDDLELAKLFVLNSTQPAAIVGTDRKLVLCNPALEEFIGWSERELKEMPFEEFTLPAYRNVDVTLFSQTIDPSTDLNKYSITKGWITRDSKHVFGLLNVFPVIKDDRVVFTIAMIKPQQEDEHEKVMNRSVSIKPTEHLTVQWLRVFAGASGRLGLAIATAVFVLSGGFAYFMIKNADRVFDLLDKVIK